MGSNKNPRLPKGLVSSGPGQRGQLLGQERNPLGWRVGSILDYSPQNQTYHIRDGLGGEAKDVPRMVNDPGEVGILSPGTQVVINNEINNRPMIVGVLKGAATSAVEVNPARISEVRGVGGEDGVYDLKNPAADMRAPNDPIDVIADDWIRKGKHNNFTGVLAGGTNIMHSSPMAQIRTHSVNDMVEVIANTYRHISSMGNLEVINDGGKTSLIWKAGADQSTENGANAENWTLRLEAGKEGDLFRLKVTTPHNNTLCELHMSADGRLSLIGVAGIDISSGTRGTAREDVAENKEVQVLGGMATTVGGEVVETFGASLSTSINNNVTQMTGNDLKEVVGHDRLTHISNKLITTVEGGGKVPPPDTGNIAILWDAINGGIESVTGNKGVSTVKQSQNFVNYAGDFNFALNDTSGKFNLISTSDDSVLLGADGAATSTPAGHTFTPTAEHHVCMWEEFKEFAQTLMDWADTHVHLTAMGPSSPASASATKELSAKLKDKIPPVKSKRVKVGA